MHDRDSNDSPWQPVPPRGAKLGSFQRGGGLSVGSVGAMFRDLGGILLLMVMSVAAILALRHPGPSIRYFSDLNPSSADVLRRAFTAELARESNWLKQSQRVSDFAKEQQMNAHQLIDRWNPLIAEASKRFNVPAAWIRAVMQMESGGRTMLAEGKPITSPTGAVGLLQLEPDTYEDMRKALKLGADPFNPRDNIMAGAAYLHWLHQRYGFPAMFIAYNDGPGNLEAHKSHGRSLPQETRNYISKICNMLGAAIPVFHSPAAKTKLAKLKFTKPNGRPVWVDTSKVASVRAPLPHEYPRSVKAVITMGRMKQAVRESVAVARNALRGRGRAA
jgi:Transglycosylase SLT domain